MPEPLVVKRSSAVSRDCWLVMPTGSYGCYLPTGEWYYQSPTVVVHVDNPLTDAEILAKSSGWASDAS